MRFFCTRISLARIPQQLPRRSIFAVPDPHVEIRVNPRRGKDVRHGRNLRGRRNRLGPRQRADVWIVLDTAVELAQKPAPIFREVFPSILAIQENADRYRLSRLHMLSDEPQPPVQVRGRGFRVHTAIDETDEIGNMMIAEEPDDLFAVGPKPPRAIEPVGIGCKA